MPLCCSCSSLGRSVCWLLWRAEMLWCYALCSFWLHITFEGISIWRIPMVHQLLIIARYLRLDQYFMLLAMPGESR